ncbi:LamG-like jellyroll fold domain-containing protein [Geofilum rubicundum]|nr:RICIN domain-containing protein [Geofilum rubicundum]
MKKRFLSSLYIIWFGCCLLTINAQIIPDRTVPFNVSDSGEAMPIIWGLDLAWLSEGNILRGMAFMGADRVDLVRSSFTPTAPLVDGELQSVELGRLNERLDIIALLNPETKVVLNCDHPTVDPWFDGHAARWAQLIDVTTRHHQEAGRTVVTVSPFNEPDYGWGQGSMLDFYNIAGELRDNPRFDNIRISGGNTLNNDEALNWYNFLKSRLDEGNTHQLAGSFDNYAHFYETVRANGHHATNDELHNVMEAMVGVEYGMQTGIWWGTAELARGEFVKASDGERLAYAEHRPNWTAASVYRNPEGKVQAFGGTSERMAVTTSYRFVSLERDVYFDGHGPQREYTMVLPGGTGYQAGQTNAERVVNITWGDDIQPVIDGRYVLVNRHSGLVMEVANGATNAGANLQQGINNGAIYQQWNVRPVDSRVGGDFSYFSMTAVHSGKAPDILNWSLNNGGNIIVWDDVKGVNQQWYLDYAEDGWFYIRSRHSAKCLEIANSSSSAGANIQQWDKDGGANQQWRFLPIDAPVEFEAPDSPEDLSATANAESIQLDWSASPASDLKGYTVFRAESAGGPYSTIARNISGTSFVDHSTASGTVYYYTVKATDHSLNTSASANEVSAMTTGDDTMVAQFQFEENFLDSSVNLNHAKANGEVDFVEGPIGASAIGLNGSDSFLQLPPTIANQQELSIATWVYWNGGASWQPIFGFGNDLTQYMYLTPRLRFAIKNGGTEQRLNGSALPTGQWAHVVVTLSESGAELYVNGELVDTSQDIVVRPLDFKPVLNYIGRGEHTAALFNGRVDDFRIYNYALTPEEVVDISASPVTGLTDSEPDLSDTFSVWPTPANDVLNLSFSQPLNQNGLDIEIYNMNGRMVMNPFISSGAETTILNISGLPNGIYLLKLFSGSFVSTRKIVVSR